jgi:hypothetical protein
MSWGEDALLDQFYAGLKDYVKDEISRSGRPDGLRAMIELAQKIDNRHYERQLEKKGGNSNWLRNKGKKGSYWPQPMELDATFKPSGRPKGKGRDPRKEKQFKERLCFNCNKPGHIAKLCTQSKKRNNGRRYGKQLNATWNNKNGYKELNATSIDWDEETLAGDAEVTMVNEPSMSAQGTQTGTARRIEEGGINRGYPLPPPPTGWNHSREEWWELCADIRVHPSYPWKQEHDEKMKLNLSMQQWQDRIFGWAERLGLYTRDSPRFEEREAAWNEGRHVGPIRELDAELDDPAWAEKVERADENWPPLPIPTGWTFTQEQWEELSADVFLHQDYPWKKESDLKLEKGLSSQEWQDRLFTWAYRLKLCDWSGPTKELNATSASGEFWDEDDAGATEYADTEGYEDPGEESLTTSEQEAYDYLTQDTPSHLLDREWAAQKARAHRADMREMQRIHKEQMDSARTYHKGRMDALGEFAQRWRDRQEAREATITEPEASNQFERRYLEQEESLQETPLEPWEVQADKAGLDYEPTDKDIADLEERLQSTRLINKAEERGPTKQPPPKWEPTKAELENLVKEINETHDQSMHLDMELEDYNVAEIDHPWHNYVPWTDCYTDKCDTHYAQKEKHKTYPRNQIPIYYSWSEMKEIIRRRRSTGQLQSKN